MNKKILVIEDDQVLAESIIDILERDGYDITVTLSGHEGLAWALTNQPDLIILDILLPDIDGYHIYRRLLDDEWGKAAKLLVLTASESKEEIAKNINLSAEYVLFKPETSVEELRNRVIHCLNA